jgi:hypothetical protein
MQWTLMDGSQVGESSGGHEKHGSDMVRLCGGRVGKSRFKRTGESRLRDNGSIWLREVDAQVSWVVSQQ